MTRPLCRSRTRVFPNFRCLALRWSCLLLSRAARAPQRAVPVRLPLGPREVAQHRTAASSDRARRGRHVHGRAPDQFTSPSGLNAANMASSPLRTSGAVDGRTLQETMGARERLGARLAIWTAEAVKRLCQWICCVPRSLDDGSFSDLNSSEVQGAEWGPSSLTKKRSRETSKATRLHSSITHPTHPEHAHGQLGLVLLPHRPKIDPVRIGVVHARREVKTQSISGGPAQDLLGMLGGGI